MYPLTINNDDSVEQLSLDGIEISEGVAKKRLKEAKKILGDNFSRLKRTIIITYDYFEEIAVNGVEILVDNNFNIIDKLSIPEYRSPSPDDNKTKQDNKEKLIKPKTSSSIVKWNANKIKRPIAGEEENGNGISN